MSALIQSYEHLEHIESINQKFSELDGKVNVSFEFFPPNSDQMHKTLWDTVKRLETLQPDFVSVTYGAAASTRERTHQVIDRILSETSLTPVPHLTCIDATEGEIETIANNYWDKGIRHIVALRGDVEEQQITGEFKYAVNLIEKLKQLHNFEITVAAYPEVHPEAPDANFDLDNLKRKIDAGATRAISQFFFNTEVFLRFRDRCIAQGIDIEITPGILPVTNFEQLVKFSKFTNVAIPTWMEKLYQGLEGDPTTRKLIASHLAIEQVKHLSKEGINNFHFYTLNRAELTYAICHSLGKRQQLQINRKTA
ncbi:MAG: methylenetetrahydrofolate reductase [Kangiellaceae bacterium]|nr:methylenetetrahydrofolate reductase [Kangiellaceae bacterium]